VAIPYELCGPPVGFQGIRLLCYNFACSFIWKINLGFFLNWDAEKNILSNNLNVYRMIK
jgi:hypothetical protein